MIINKIPSKKRVFFVISTAMWMTSVTAFAAPLEEINFTTDSDKVVAIIKLSSPVANVRYSPARKGRTLSILFDRLPAGPATEEWQDSEVLPSPPSNLIPSFTISNLVSSV